MTENTKDISKTELISKRLQLDISKDSYEVYVTASGPELPLSDIQAALEADGVVYGVDLNAAHAAIQNPGHRTLVAKGSRHTDGIDGYFERVNGRPQSEVEKRFGIRNVRAGDVLGVIHKPTSGSVGIDVCGRKVQPHEGRPANIFSSPNIRRADTEDKIVLEATADGFLNVGSASIEINEEHVFHGDIDYSDGELDFAGSLRIVGDIKGSGDIRVRHDLFIDGSVEDAKIIAGGNVKVTGSFVGRGDGLIRAEGNVSVNVVLNQMIEAGGSITIVRESVNAHLIATDTVTAKNATIMGGTVTAGEKIEVLTLGGELYSTTRVKLGLAELWGENMIAIDKEIELQTKTVEQLKDEIYLLVRERIDSNNFTAEKAEQLKLLQDKLRRQNEIVQELTSKKQERVLEMNRKRSPKLIVLGTIHQSVAAEINGVRLHLKQSFRNVTFEELRNEIIRTKNL